VMQPQNTKGSPHYIFRSSSYQHSLLIFLTM
jgi:hypothetical protein